MSDTQTVQTPQVTSSDTPPSDTFSSGTFDVSSYAQSLDTHAAYNDEGSIFETLGNLVTKAAPLTALSIINSFANTGIAVGNFFGSDYKPLNVQDELDTMGASSDTKAYYDAHSQGIEAAGFIVGSLAPGLGGIKLATFAGRAAFGGASRAAMAAMELSQDGSLTQILSRTTGILAGPKQSIISEAYGEIMAKGGGLYANLGSDKLKLISLGFADQALQATAYELATLATMKQSPLLSEDDLGTVVHNVFFGALVGGGIGGAIEGIVGRGLMNATVLRADTATKSAELLRKGGLGNAGDRAALLVNSFMDIPAQETVLGSQKLTNARTSMLDTAKTYLQEFTDADDKWLAPPIMDAIMKQINAGNVSKEELYNSLGRLNSIKNVLAEPQRIDTGQEFYLNSFGPKKVPDSWDEFVSAAKINSDGTFEPATPNSGADISRRYALAPNVTPAELSIAHFDMPLPTLQGKTIPRYPTSKEAWADGADIFINKELKVLVNPDSSNIVDRIPRPGESRLLTQAEERVYRATGEGLVKPLVAAPTYFNVLSGELRGSMAPVVGDLGPSRNIPSGLLYGKGQVSRQSLEQGLIDSDTSTIDASARYVYARNRGIKAGDSIDPTDIPFLEQLHREATLSKDGYGEAMQQFEKRGVNLADGTDLPTSPEEFISMIRGAKDELGAEAVTAGRSSEEVGRIANISEDYIKNAFNGPNEQFLLDSGTMGQVNHVRLDYQMGGVLHDNDGNIVRGMMDSQYRVKLITDTAEAMTTRYFAGKAQFVISNKKAGDGNIFGVRSGILSSTNANYDTLGQSMESIGRFLGKWIADKNQGNANLLTPSIQALRNNPEAATELNMFNFIRRSSSEKWVEYPSNMVSDIIPGATGSSGERMIAVLDGSLIKDKQGKIVGWNRDYIPEGFVQEVADSTSPNFIGPQQKGFHTFYQLSPEVTNFERVQQQINAERIYHKNNWYSAMGLSREMNPNVLHAPALDTNRYPFIAYVKIPRGVGMADDDVSVIIAKDAASLTQKVSHLGPEYEVYYKEQIKTNHLIKGDYDYSRNFGESGINSDMQRKGILNDLFPETNFESTVSDITTWNARQEARLARDYVELGNNQLFAELDSMGTRFSSAQTSRKPGFLSSIAPSVDNPYNSYVRTALNVQDRESYRLWSASNEKAEAFFSTAFETAANALRLLQRGEITPEQASQASQRYGLGNVYGSVVDGLSSIPFVSNKLPPKAYLQKFVASANSVLQAGAIRLDQFQSLINVTSMPILAMSELNSARGQLMAKLLTTELPDASGRMIPAATKVLFEAVGDWFKSDLRNPLMARYTELGAVRKFSSDTTDRAFEALTLPRVGEDLTKKLSNIVDIGAKLSGADYSENFVRFVAARAADKLFSAAGYVGQELDNNIGTFVNRVHGNFVASQRPIAFQGPIGQAVGLFQTYQFNMMQQLFRYVENGDSKTLAILGALQTSLFGLNGLPGFQAINNHIVGNAAGNPQHKDVYSTLPNLIGETMGRYLLYGGLSNVLQSGLYNRGDINPRQLSIIPINPVDYPAISGGIRFIGNMMDTANSIANGGAVGASLLLGLEHNALNRPLSGLAQLVQGFTTTQDGQLVSAVRPGMQDNTAGWNDLVSVANFSRLLGSRPLDEAVIMDAMYSKKLYDAKDRSRIEGLGTALKTQLYSDSSQLDEQTVNDFTARYAASGGYQPNFGRFVARNMIDATTSKANQFAQHMQMRGNQQFQIIMGGRPLPDFISRAPNTGSTANASTQTSDDGE